MTPGRVRMLALLLPVLVSAVAFAAWSQRWISVTLSEGRAIDVGGDVAAPAVPPLALAAFALVGALALAGPVFRVILGLLQALLGLGVVTSGLLVLRDPVQAAAPRITEATGIDGLVSVRALVTEVAVSPWPGVTITAGVGAMLAGIAIAVTAQRWPPRTRRYEQSRSSFVEEGAERDQPATWDALSDGDDPTAR